MARISVAVAVIFVFSLIDATYVFARPIGIGVDGYYYSIQIDSLFGRGTLYFPTYTPFVLYFLTAIKFFIQDTILAVKIGTSILQLLLSIGIFSLVRIATRNPWLGILSIFILGISRLHLYLVVEYISYLGAIAFIVWGFVFTTLGLRSRKSIWFGVATGCFVVAAGSHRSAIPIVLTVVVALAVVCLFLEAFDKNRQKLVLATAFATIFFFFGPALLAAQPFFQLPFALEKEFRVIPWIPARLANLPEVLILALLCPLTLVAVTRWKAKVSDGSARIIFGTIALWSILITLNPFISSHLGFLSLGGRLRTLAYIQAAIIVPGIIWLLKDSRPKLVWGITALVIPLMSWSAFFNPLPRGTQPEYLEHRESLVNGLKSGDLQIEPNSLIVADHGDQFVVTAVTGIPSQQEFPEENTYQAVYWLLNKIPSTLIDSSMKTVAKDSGGLHLILVKDDDAWRERIQNPQVRGQFLKNNPHLRIFLSKQEQVR